jgi:hypothetical protein
MPRAKMLQIPVEYAGLTLETLAREGQAKIDEGKKLLKLAEELKAGHAAPKRKAKPKAATVAQEARPEPSFA